MVTKVLRAGVAALVLCCSSAWATSMFRLDLNELTLQSDAVVQGTVKSVESRWSGDRSRIYTEIVVEVTDPITGQVSGPVVIRQPGGSVGDIGQIVSGLASFERGEEVVLFLEKRGTGFSVTGMGQGKFKVERSSDRKAAFAIPDKVEARLIDRKTGAEVAQELKAMDLKALRDQVRKLAATRRPSRSTP